MDEGTYNRRVVQILGITQPRCAERHGVSPCDATGAECYNTFATCGFKSAYRREGSIEWMFSRPGDPVPWTYERDGEHIRTNCIEALRSVSSISSTINVATSRIGESPFGIIGSLSFAIADFPWRDEVGDFYSADRAEIIEASFWAKFKARIGEAVTQCKVTLYTGYEGQALSEMQQRRYDLRAINGPSNGAVRGMADAPTRKLGRRYAQFPRSTDIELLQGLDEASTAVQVRAALADLDDDFGNTGTRRFLRIGSEVIEYTGFTEVAAPVYDLTGVVRGAVNTVAQEHSAGDACQRHGRFERIRPYDAVRYLIREHTPVDGALIDDAQWDAEGARFLSTIQVTGDVPEPTPVEEVAGELARDGLFSVWWDDRTQLIEMIPNRPPTEVPVILSDEYSIVADSASLSVQTEDRLTRVNLSYGKFNPTDGADDFTNYRFTRLRVDAEGESDDFSDGSIRESRIFSRWIRTGANALRVNASVLQRYKFSPEYLTIDVDAKDRHLGVASVVDIESREIIDAFGNPQVRRWQVISWTETEPGHRARLKLQSYFFIGRFGVIMPNNAPDYATATEAERAEGCWLADGSTGLMPNGDEPYLLW